MKTWKWLIGILLLACSCQREEEYTPAMPPEDYPEGATMQVTFTLDGGDPATKALDEGGELKNLYLAVFGKNGYLKEYVQANYTGPTNYTYTTNKVDAAGNPVLDDKGEPVQVSHTVNRYAYTARLSLADSKRTVHFIGNAPSTLSFGWDSEVMAGLCCAPGEMGYWQMLELENGIRAKRYTGEEDYEDENHNIVTKGDYIDNDGNKVTTKNGYVPDTETTLAFQGPEKKGLALIRNWAKIEVTTEEGSNFVPDKFAVVEVPKYGTYAPYFSKAGKGVFVQNYQEYGFKDLEEYGYYGNLPASADFDSTIPTFTDVKNTDGSRNAVYLYERPAPTSNLKPSYVIVHGYFTDPDISDGQNDSGPYYYRVDLMETTQKKDPVTGQVVDWESSYYPIYRNFKYTVNIKRILSRGQDTPEKAIKSAGSADVSADINTSSLDEISDGIGRLHLSWMNYTHVSENKDKAITDLFVYFSQDNVSAPDKVTVKLLPAEDGGEDIIENLTLGPAQEYEGSQGWRPILFTIKAYNGKVARTQVIRVTGNYGEGRLYRDVYITVQPIQPMQVDCSRPIIARVKGSPQIIKFMIPDGLVSGMFPLEFTIEAEDMTLTPDQDVSNNNLPVVSRATISEHTAYLNKTAFQFLRTLSWEEYRSLPQIRDASSKVWRSVSCYFKTNRNVSATTVWVYNSYFEKGHVTFEHYDMKQFNNLTFDQPIPSAEGEKMSLSFDLEQDSGRSYPEAYPTITINAIGLRRDMDLSPDILSGEGDTYLYKPKTSDTHVVLHFITSGEGGNISIDLMADEYDDGHLEPCHFTHVGFVDAMPLASGNNKWSNVLNGHINILAGKTVIFGFRLDPNKPTTPVTVTTKLGNSQTNAGLVAYGSQTPSGSWTPTEGRLTPTQNMRTGADPLYHEIEYLTPSPESYADIHLTISSPGYVTQTITAGRWGTSDASSPYSKDVMNIMSQKLGDVIKNGSESGESWGIWKSTYRCAVSLQGVTVDSNYWKLAQSGNYVLTFDNTDNVSGLGLLPENCPIFIARLGFYKSGSVSYVPDSLEPSVGTLEPYLGAENQYFWYIPSVNTASITLKAPLDHGITFSSLVIADARNIRFYDGL